MKVGLLGCHGFIGSHFLRRLVGMGTDVVGIDRYAFIPSWRKDIIPQSFRAICGDLLDSRIIHEYLREVDLILFAAGNPSPASASFDLLFGEELRIIVDLLAFMAARNRSARLLFISSGGTVYGPRPHGTLCREDDPLSPTAMYGVMKLACEKTIGAYAAQYGLRTTILRVANAYGIGQNPNGQQGLIPVVLKKLLSNGEIKIWGDGSTYRDYVFIDDVSDLVEIVVANEAITGIYNVGSGQGVSTKEIIRMASHIAGREPRVQFIEARPQDLEWNALSIAKTTRQLDWRPRVSLEAGIRRIYEWMCYQYHETGVKE